MMTKKEVLDFINEAIEEEKGQSVGMDDMFTDSDLDSLGITLVLVALDDKYGQLEGLEEGNELKDIDKLTVRDLVNRCLLASLDTSKERKDETAT